MSSFSKYDLEINKNLLNIAKMKFISVQEVIMGPRPEMPKKRVLLG